MKNLIYTICSPYYEPVLKMTAPKVLEYAFKVNADFQVFTNKDRETPTTPLNRHEQFVSKFSHLLEAGSNYANVMYLDCDIVIKSSAENIFNLYINNIGGRKASEFIEQQEHLRVKADRVFPLFNKQYFINGGLFIGDYESVRFFCKRVIDLITNKDLIDDDFMTDEVYMAEVIRCHFPDYTDVGQAWNTSYVGNKDSYHFVHCMARTLEGKINQIRSLL